MSGPPTGSSGSGGGTSSSPTAITAISISFSARPTGAIGKEVTQTLDAIDAVHRGPRLPVIPIEEEFRADRYGAYWRTPSGKPTKITVNRLGALWGLTLAHEMGHVLDDQAFGTAGI